jgi:hypothetical protein
MRQIAAGLFTSLDGVVEAPENWTGPYRTGVVHLTYEPAR